MNTTEAHGGKPISQHKPKLRLYLIDWPIESSSNPN